MSTKEELTLGQKIRKFREQKGLSQFELEIAIEASPGSLSRIESGQVNPTKETLSKLAKALKLNPKDISELLGLEIFTPEELIIAINTISKCLDLNTTLQTSVDIMFDLYPNYNGGVIFLRDSINPNWIFSQTVSKMPKMDMAIKLLPKRFSDFKIELSRDDNLVVYAVKNKSIYQSFRLNDFSKGVVSDVIINQISYILNFKSGVVLPLIFDNEVIGAALYTKRVRERFTVDKENLLTLLNDQLAISISKSKLISELIVDIDNLKSKINKTLNI